MIKNKLTYISLFSSSGVGCYGFKMEGFECIATNEIVERRLNVQKLNNKCKYDTGYILGNIEERNIKDKVFIEVDRWKKEGNDTVDVVIATPPCQGMSVANHKKNDKDVDRNSLVRESIDIINEIQPRFFVFENVSRFLKTGCINKSGELVEIGTLIEKELSSKYNIEYRVINFKNYGSNSSRLRTLVIGVNKKLSENITPTSLFPEYREEKTLKEVIGNFKTLQWGEYDEKDFYHSFRIYQEHMREWIKDIKEGQSAFDNTEIEKKPHQIIDGKIVVNKSKNGDKYKRQIFNKVAPCIHTRNDQMASQNTLHPTEDRVFSIRELMKMMTIPSTFKWIDKSLNELNNLSYNEKRKISKKHEINIRQSIGEAVPTEIFRQIAEKIKWALKEKYIQLKI